MQSAMNQILRDFVPEKTIPFVDDIPIKSCQEGAKDLTLNADGCRVFVKNHITDVNRILERLEEVDLTLSIDKSKFGFDEILVVGHLCGRYGRKPNPEKVDAIARMKACSSITEVRRFLGACVFYQIWEKLVREREARSGEQGFHFQIFWNFDDHSEADLLPWIINM
jgi:hypothetical protein